MDEVEVVVNEERAPGGARDYNLRCLQAEILERHRAVTWPNCGCLSKTVPEPTFDCLLKCVFLIVVCLSVLSDLVLGQFLPKDNLLNPRVTWKAVANLTWPLIPSVSDWKTNVLLIMFAAVIYARAFLRKPKKTTGSAVQRGEVQTVSASIQQV